MTPAAPLIDIEGLGVSFKTGGTRDDVQSLAYRALRRRPRADRYWALRDLTFSVGGGRTLGIVGRNGAGKSTLCRVLTGLLRPDEGRAHVSGTVSSLLSLGAGFKLEMTGRENAILNGLFLGKTRATMEPLVDSIIEFAGIGPFADQPLKFFSSGMRSRLGFSIATTLEPDILVLDESLSVGDAEFTARAGRRLEALMARARLVVLVSHHLDLLTRYCSDVLWLEGGRCRAFGPPADVVEAYNGSIHRKPRAVVGVRVKEGAHSGAPTVVSMANVSVDFALRAGGTAGRRTVAKNGAAVFRALEDVSLAVAHGEVLGIIGPNGAGKTTLCRLMGGVLRPDRGRIDLTGRVTALLTLNAGLNQQLSGRDNVMRLGLLLGLSGREIRARFDEIVRFSELERVIDEPVKHYSSGMRARLAFSTITAVDPDVLIIDEALSVGDAAFARKATARITRLMRKASAVIVVTHNLRFVEEACTRAIWLEAGRVVADGPPATTVASYRAAAGEGKRALGRVVKSAAVRSES